MDIQLRVRIIQYLISVFNFAMSVQFCCSEIEQAGHVSFGLRKHDPPDIEGKRELQPMGLHWDSIPEGDLGTSCFSSGFADCQRSFFAS